MLDVDLVSSTKFDRFARILHATELNAVSDRHVAYSYAVVRSHRWLRGHDSLEQGPMCARLPIYPSIL